MGDLRRQNFPHHNRKRHKERPEKRGVCPWGGTHTLVNWEKRHAAEKGHRAGSTKKPTGKSTRPSWGKTCTANSSKMGRGAGKNGGCIGQRPLEKGNTMSRVPSGQGKGPQKGKKHKDCFPTPPPHHKTKKKNKGPKMARSNQSL